MFNLSSVQGVLFPVVFSTLNLRCASPAWGFCFSSFFIIIKVGDKLSQTRKILPDNLSPFLEPVDSYPLISEQSLYRALLAKCHFFFALMKLDIFP